VNSAALCLSLLAVLLVFAVNPLVLLALGCRRRRGAGGAAGPDQPLPTLTMLTVVHGGGEAVLEKVRNFLSLDYPADRADMVVFFDGEPDVDARRIRETGGERVAVSGLPSH
jgi:hypothetical protein